jgi:hypothetical protein
MIDNLCCICLENNSNTIKCSQCVNKFHSECISSWAITLLTNKFLIFNLFDILNVSCPCCRTTKHNYTLKLILLYNLINRYKYVFIGLLLLFVILIYFIYQYISVYSIEIYIILYHIITIVISMLIEKFCIYYNIPLQHPFFHDE